MPLMSLWQSNPDAVEQLTIEQIVVTAGDGRLSDGTDCQAELREYLRQAPVTTLAIYADYCLTNSFNKSGLVLQDIVNELGRRLEYQVVNGRYQGTRSEVGFDGLWSDPTGQGIVVEVKTTDAYRLSLNTLAGYQDALIKQGRLQSPCSILIVVGRTDTGEMEAQIRGSQHAWHIRLISIDGLLNLVRIKESTDSSDTIAKIRKVLTPIEYTRLDELIDVMFTATQDVETAATAEAGDASNQTLSEGAVTKWEFTPTEAIQEKRQLVVDAFGRKLGIRFVRKTRALYWDSDHTTRIVCTISKRYSNPGLGGYWYAYHPSWDEFLGDCSEAYLVLGGMDIDVAFVLPLSSVRDHLDELNVTERKDSKDRYWHVKIVENEVGQYRLQLPRTSIDLPLKDKTLAIGCSV